MSNTQGRILWCVAQILTPLGTDALIFQDGWWLSPSLEIALFRRELPLPGLYLLPRGNQHTASQCMFPCKAPSSLPQCMLATQGLAATELTASVSPPC